MQLVCLHCTTWQDGLGARGRRVSPDCSQWGTATLELAHALPFRGERAARPAAAGC